MHEQSLSGAGTPRPLSTRAALRPPQGGRLFLWSRDTRWVFAGFAVGRGRKPLPLVCKYQKRLPGCTCAPGSLPPGFPGALAVSFHPFKS